MAPRVLRASARPAEPLCRAGRFNGNRCPLPLECHGSSSDGPAGPASTGGTRVTKSAGLVAVLGCAVFAGLLATGATPRAAGADEPGAAAAEPAPPHDTPPREKPFESI